MNDSVSKTNSWKYKIEDLNEVKIIIIFNEKDLLLSKFINELLSRTRHPY